MRLTLNINYRTEWGESLYVCGNTPELGMNNRMAAKPMTLVGDGNWTAEINITAPVDIIEYFYFVRKENTADKEEWGAPHSLKVAKEVKAVIADDRWSDMPWNKPYYSTAFTDCICHRSKKDKPLVSEAGKVTIVVAAPMIQTNQVLALIGENEALGKWAPSAALRMNDGDFPFWKINIPASDIPAGTQFKFVILDKKTGNQMGWDGNDNYVMPEMPRTMRTTAVVVSGLRFANPSREWRGAGTAIPVFSLRTDDDFGVGDFYDLKQMVDWCASTGQSFLQILPINDTTMTGTWTDSYPYNANSTFALHPMFLRLSELGVLKDAERQKYFDSLGKELNSLREIDYERVNNAKNQFYREIFAQEGAKVMATVAFKSFVKNNLSWLRNYASFCVLRDKFGTPDFSEWGEYAEFTPEKVNKIVETNADEINLVYYIQYNLDKQLRHVRNYAHSKGIAIKGDIPIGISRTSVDAWTDTRLFNMDCQAGAPPDDFSVLGQNWGFPTYNWEEMARDGFAWWKSRFRKMSEYFDAYRIDHVLGFFRIWQIPMDALHGLLGYFNPAMPYSPDELRNSFDFWLNVDMHTKPYIMDYFLHDFFGEYTDEVRDRFLEPLSYGRYRLKAEYDTQRKVAEYFATQDKNDKNTAMCNGLLGLIDEVLFIEDPVEKGKYHPRISAQFTYIYRSLNDYERWCFDRMYNDFFYHRHNDFWYGKAMWKLPPLINATDMLVCAEDLGMIPDCVPAVMSKLEILSLEIQRMPKDPKSEFGNTWAYPYLSVCTTSTHDMGGIRQWWEEDRAKTEHFYNNVLHRGGEAPYFCEPWICKEIIDLHLKSPSMLCIIPLQDYLAMDDDVRRADPREEQINVPANPRHYWRYRMHLTMSELMASQGVNDMLRGMIAKSGR